MISENIFGYLEGFDKSLITGWVFRLNDNNPLNIRLFVNDKYVCSNLADKFRKGLKRKSKHLSGNCGFEFDLSKFALPPRFTFGVKLEGENTYLNSTKLVYNKYIKNSILIMGLAKSGTSILTYKIAEALDNTKIHFEPEGKKGVLKLDYHRRALLNKNNDNIVTKLIYYPLEVSAVEIQKLSGLYSKKIWIFRDPRDVILSSFFYRWNKSHNMPKEDFLEAVRRTKLKEQNPSKFSLIEMLDGFIDVRRFIRFNYGHLLKFMNAKNWYFIQYEDLVDHRIVDLEKYLKFEIDNDTELPTKLTRVVRSKKYGNWRYWFNDKDVEILRPILNPILESLNYNPNDWELKYTHKLNPNFGSNYMAKIHND